MYALTTSGSSPQRSLRVRAFLAVSAACLALLSVASFAQAPAISTEQAPGYYRVALGDFQVTALYDGAIYLPTRLLHGIDDGDTRTMLSKMFVPVTENGVQTAVNGFLLNTGTDLILVDAGAAACFGPTLGGMHNSLRAAGYEPAQISKVFLTHLHGDHVCGITNDGKMAYPNATVYVAKAEADYWLNKEIAAQAPKDAQSFFQMARSEEHT